MKKIEIDEYKKLVYGCLVEFHRVCIEHNLRYTIAFGTLIGAIRHNGFIPWDDDIDVIMPREDYIKLISISEECFSANYKLLSIENTPRYTAPLAKFVDTRTSLVQRKITDGVELGVYLDVFVYDNVYNNGVLRRMQYIIADTLNKCWNYCVIDRDAPLTNLRRIIKRILFHSDGRFYAVLMNAFAKWGNGLKTANKSNLLFGIVKRNKYEIPSEAFDNLIDVQFEDIKVKAIASYDAVLRKYYGDYMRLPPTEQRVTHHHFDVYWKNM